MISIIIMSNVSDEITRQNARFAYFIRLRKLSRARLKCNQKGR